MPVISDFPPPAVPEELPAQPEEFQHPLPEELQQLQDEFQVPPEELLPPEMPADDPVQHHQQADEVQQPAPQEELLLPEDPFLYQPPAPDAQTNQSQVRSTHMHVRIGTTLHICEWFHSMQKCLVEYHIKQFCLTVFYGLIKISVIRFCFQVIILAYWNDKICYVLQHGTRMYC